MGHNLIVENKTPVGLGLNWKTRTTNQEARIVGAKPLALISYELKKVAIRDVRVCGKHDTRSWWKTVRTPVDKKKVSVPLEERRFT